MANDRGTLPDLTLQQLRHMMTRLGVRRLLVKELAPNDNSKNQPYLSGSMEVTNILPVGEVYVDETPSGNRIMKALLPLDWLQPDGTSAPAPHAKLILYPQYPEVRFSGFLQNATNAPSSVMTTRVAGRLLFLGRTATHRIIAWAVGPDSRIAAEVRTLTDLEQIGVFRSVPLTGADAPSRLQLLSSLRRIHQQNWIMSKALRSDGRVVRCDSTNCVGYTLEAELGVSRNGVAEPDYLGWEVKASQVTDFTRIPASKAVTLFTPEPTGGYYCSAGIEGFVRKFGYPDKRGRPNRLNFGGVYRTDQRHPGTALTLRVRGFDAERRELTDAAGALALVSDSGETAAEWAFSALLSLWNRKHAKAAYVPAEVRAAPERQYRYGMIVQLGERTDFIRLMHAIACGKVYYDPGIKVERGTNDAPTSKRRSQFRVRFSDLAELYDSMTSVSVLSESAA
ncbi:MAG: hypothetical protein FJ194_19715 [Gammaproteobacteria bacterium]|nr:hypothetical protein [Gammaproteobacteria bacterium]